MPFRSKPQHGNEVGKSLLALDIAFLQKLWHCVVLKEVNRMELWKESLLTAMDDRFDAAYQELRKTNADVEKAVQRQMDASVLVKDHPDYDDELKRLVEDYFGAMQLLLDAYNRHLYIQGAKDCVVVLRELGVIR